MNQWGGRVGVQLSYPGKYVNIYFRDENPILTNITLDNSICPIPILKRWRDIFKFILLSSQCWETKATKTKQVVLWHDIFLPFDQQTHVCEGQGKMPMSCWSIEARRLSGPAPVDSLVPMARAMCSCQTCSVRKHFLKTGNDIIDTCGPTREVRVNDCRHNRTYSWNPMSMGGLHVYLHVNITTKNFQSHCTSLNYGKLFLIICITQTQAL